MWNISPHFRSYNVTGLGKNFLTLFALCQYMTAIPCPWLEEFCFHGNTRQAITIILITFAIKSLI